MTRLWKTIQWPRVALAALAVWIPAWSQALQQTPPQQTDWRHIGNAALDSGLAGIASGPVARVWYSEDGGTLSIRTRTGKTFSTGDFETWQAVPGGRTPDSVNAAVDRSPEPAAGGALQVRQAQRGRLYAAGRFVYRSEDGGVNWSNLTESRGESILGEGVNDVAVSPIEPDDLTVAAATGVWRSTDGGMTWASLNAGLPNLTFSRILATPNGVHGVRIAQGSSAFEWAPGERMAWRETVDADFAAELQRNDKLSKVFNAAISTSAQSGDTVYAGFADGRIASSTDAGATWKIPFRLAGAGRIERIMIDPLDARIALAAVGLAASDQPPQTHGIHIERTVNGGVFWDDLTANLPDVPAHGVAFERSSGAIYVANEAGVYWTRTDLNSLGAATQWASAGAGLPEGVPVVDVRLDPGGNQLYAGLLGLGVYSTTAPHRRTSPRVVSAADYSSRAIAPGSVLTVFGSQVRTAVAGGVDAPVLASSELRSEIQIPFDAHGSTLTLAVESGSGDTLRFPLPLESVSPAIFVDRDGTPMLLDSDSGALLDSSTPAHAGSHVQILSTGLGRVSPEWPAGTKAPADNPPAVVANVHAFVGGQETGVTKAILAPGYVGLYLVEIQLPTVVNYGPTELVISIDGKESNRVRLYVEP